MRHAIFVFAALLVTTLLFLLMRGLIESDVPVAPPFEPIEAVKIVRLQPAEPAPPVDAMPDPIKPPPPPDFAPDPMDRAVIQRDDIDFAAGRFGVAVRGAMPLVAFEPRYPREALRDGLTGWVRIEFTIRPDGSVGDARVVAAEPKRGIFDHVALHSLARSRFVPKTVDGVAVPSRAEHTFIFTIEDRQ